MMKPRFLAILWAAVLFATATNTASACSCDRQTIQAAYQNAEIVFEARIIEVNGPITTGAWPAGVVKFSVSKVWKGQVPSDFEMPAVRVGGSCLGFYPSLLERGNELLVYAKASAWTPNGDKAFFANACSRTQLLKNAKADLDFLRTVAKREAMSPK